MLAWVALAFLFSAIYARLSRAQMLETLSEDFVRTARAKGLRQTQVYGRHALRAAITPMVTIAGLDVGAALGGTVITETTFGLQGLGRTAVDAVRAGDLPTIMATVLVAAAFIVVANIVVDLLYAVIDPRVRLTSWTDTSSRTCRGRNEMRHAEPHWPRAALLALVVGLGACSENTGEGDDDVDTDTAQTGVDRDRPEGLARPGARGARRDQGRHLHHPAGDARSPTWTRSGSTRSPA